MDLFVLSTRAGKPFNVKYCGMTQENITTLLTELGATDIQFVTKENYDAAVAALQE